ncbi:uncharacterized protein LOC132719640 [Ruditapes philippinarum]|uniref:uncharacterized protein LOC132719640 n=1 Tax=Ruditapes philippinarum TaxID=129788 RepID=UPI00295C1767|nr:uncharacterized protein LOC132719640 [Ruditapes philippinarum]
MDKFREIGVQTTFDEDDVFDISPTSTLHRGSLTSPTSPGHSSGILARVRNSFSSQKVKDLKRQLRQCEEDIVRIKEELQVTNKENNDATLRLSNILKCNPFNIYISGACRNVHVGDSNTLVQNSGTDDVIGDLEELTGKLTAAVQENTRERTNAEIKLKNNEILLKEMRESLNMCTKMLDKLDKSTSNKLGHVKQMLESLTSDRTDDRVIREGIERMRQHVIDRKRIVRVADELPWAIRVAIYRLVNKFDNFTWQEFAEVVGVNESTIQSRGGRKKDADDIEHSDILDNDMCAKILAQWITQSEENDADKLMNIIQEFDAQTSKEMTETFQKKTVGQPLLPTFVEQNQRSSMAYSETSAGSNHSWGMRRVASQQLPDHRSQFEHQLEAWKLQVEMNEKLDKMLKLMVEDRNSGKRKDLKTRQEDTTYTKMIKEGQFV